MIKPLAFIVLSLILFPTSTKAQQYSDSNSKELLNYTTRASKYNPENTKGSPYLTDEFQKGSLLNESSVMFPDVALRYNALNDEFQVKNSIYESNDNILAVMKKTDVYVKIGDAIYTYLLPSGETGGYYNVLVEGAKKSIYKKLSKKFVEGAQSVNMMTGNHPNRLVDETKYYLVDSNGTIEELPNSKNRKLKLIAKKNYKEFKKYAKSNDLNANDDEDLIKLVKYYNQNY
ncbi:hypothetical protein [uncultured Planktosalinus sp.]|uniref:hypothetical protein n=1 Tax=uncultured Planktosalinus sp. TaxID=1810935 RepID=UPI0030DD72FA